MTFEYRSFFPSLALTLFVVAPIAAERWVEFKDPSGNFSVEFQSAPGVEPKKGFRSADAPNETRTGSSRRRRDPKNSPLAKVGGLFNVSTSTEQARAMGTNTLPPRIGIGSRRPVVAWTSYRRCRLKKE
jgi:hypothetical protein